MAEYDQELDYGALRQNFEQAVDFIGREWLQEKRAEEFGPESRDHKHGSSPHSLVTRYHRGRIDLFDEDNDAPELFPDDHYSTGTHQLVVLGEHLSHLSGANVVTKSGEGISDNISVHLRPRIQNNDEWRDVLAEIEAAAMYSRNGYQVDFIEEGQTKAPDLIVSDRSSIYVECKRCSSVSKKDEKYGGLHEAIQKSIRSTLSREGIILVDIARTPSGEEAHSIDKHLPEESDDADIHQIEIPFGEIHILPFQRPSTAKPVEKHPPSHADTPKEFYNEYVSPSISAQLNKEISLDEFRSNSFQTRPKEGDERLYLEGSTFIGIIHESNQQRVKQILSQFNRSRGKFPEGYPNILHLKIPFLTELSYSEFDDLQGGIAGKLNQSSTISGVVLSWDEFKIDPDRSVTYGTVVGSIENYTPAVELPSWFDLPGRPLQKLPSILKFQE